MKIILQLTEIIFWKILICGWPFLMFCLASKFQSGFPLIFLPLGMLLFLHFLAKREDSFHWDSYISKNPKKYLTDKDPMKRKIAKKYLNFK